MRWTPGIRPSLVLFDLDGTISDSARGITTSMRHALVHHGLEVPDEDVLNSFVGPPFRVTLGGLGLNADVIDEVVATYRADYNAGRLFDNEVYPSMRELLAQLNGAGTDVAVATSKPQPTARRIIEHFALGRFLVGGVDGVFGADPDRPGDTKADVISRALTSLRRTPGSDIVMVGDRLHDVEGAAQHDIATIGVSWGYAAPGELRAARADEIVDSADQLASLLLPSPGRRSNKLEP